MKRFVKPQTSKTELDKFWNRKFNITQFLFDKQLAFVSDPSPFKVAVCSRRAGKTTACAADLVNTAINNPNVICLYITLSRNNAKKIIWRDLKRINLRYELKGLEDSTELSISFPNGSMIYLSGAKDQSEIEKFRGLPIKLCYIDECQSFRAYIQDLIDDIIAPALMDHAGTLCLIGTPGPIPTGYFHNCAEVTDTWSKHHWTFFDNNFITATSGKTHEELLNRELKRRGVSINDPGIQREWFGKWILDSDSLILHYDAKKNHFHSLMPNVEYSHIMGIDLGHDDADAIAIIAWAEQDPVTYLVDELVVPKQGITELVHQIQDFQHKYKNIHKMVVDTGGLGKKIAEEMIRRHSLPLEAADKTRKMENYAFLDDALRSGRFKAKSTSIFANDTYLVERDKDKSTADRIKVSDRFHSDIIDATLYGFKESPAFAYTKPKELPRPGTKEWADAQSSEMFEAELAGMQAEIDFNRKMNGNFD